MANLLVSVSATLVGRQLAKEQGVFAGTKLSWNNCIHVQTKCHENNKS